MPVRVRMSGLAIAVLGSWGAFVAFVGPYFGFSWDEGQRPWVWAESFGSIGIAAGCCATVGGLLLLGGRRALALVGVVAAVVGGAWFVIGPLFHPLWSSATLEPVGSGPWTTVALQLGYHTGVGIAVVGLAGYALGAGGRRPDREAPPLLADDAEEPVADHADLRETAAVGSVDLV